MTDYSATDVGGWEFPPVVSYGQFKLLTGTELTQFHFIEYALDGNGDIQRDALDQNKIWAKPYADTGSTRAALGLGFRRLPVFTEDEDETPMVGQGSRRRDISCLHEGIHDIWYASGVASRYGMRISPDVSGCRQQEVGMSIGGFCLSPGVAAGSGFIKARLFCYEELTYAEVNETTVQGYIDTYVDDAFVNGILDTGYIAGIVTGTVTDSYIQDTLDTGYITDLVTGTVTDDYISTNLDTGVIVDLITGTVDQAFVSGLGFTPA